MTTDFLGFCRKLDIIGKTGSLIQLDPNPSQVARDAARTPRDLVLKARQTGSTTFELARDVWYAAICPWSRVVAIVPVTPGGELMRYILQALALMIQSGEHRGVIPHARQVGLTLWEIGDSTLRVSEARDPRRGVDRGREASTIHRLHTMETGYIEHAGQIIYPILDCVPPVETGSEIVHESTIGNAFFSSLCRGALMGTGDYALHFAGWMQSSACSLPVAEDEVIEPTTDREIAIANLGGTPAQIKWYRRQVERRGQEGTDIEYPIHAMGALDPKGYDRAKHHQAA